MKSLLSRFSLLGAMVVVGCASLPAQDPETYRNVAYSEEELDNLVAPVALYPDALLAHILVAATFPEQVAIASRYVRERGTRNIENQGWDISVKAVAYYPPVLNMLANDEDWSIALGQAYANQSGDVMDAVQRLREMAREQGNLVTTREHTVSEDRGRIIIVPANPQVIYVPTYDPAIVYVRPIWSLGGVPSTEDQPARVWGPRDVEPGRAPARRQGQNAFVGDIDRLALTPTTIEHDEKGDVLAVW